MPRATTTTRDIKNQDTGIDVIIPTQNIIVGRLSKVIDYQIVVITNLRVFKSPDHTDNDVVQFTITKRHTDFEKLRLALESVFSGTLLPVIPKKSILLTDTLVQKSRLEFEKFLQHVAKKPKLASSDVFLQFLGKRDVGSVTLMPSSDSKLKKKKTNVQTENIFEDNNADDENGPFQNDMADNTVENTEEFADSVNSPDSLYHNMDRDTNLFGKQDYGEAVSQEDNLILPSARVADHVASADTDQSSEIDDLLKITDDLEDFKLDTSKRELGYKSKKIISVTSECKTDAETEPPTNYETLTTDDIFAYIQNEDSGTSGDLFS